MAKLVIVESPAKAKTIGKYLGDDYEVTASMGHIRDLPASQLGIDVEHGYAPQYISIKGKEKLIKELKSKAKHARLIFRIHAKFHQTCNNSGFSSGQNNTARMIPFNRPPQRAHNCMDIFRHRLRKIKRIPLILLKCFQQTKRADMHIMLIPQRTIFPGCQPYAA